LREEDTAAGPAMQTAKRLRLRRECIPKLLAAVAVAILAAAWRGIPLSDLPGEVPGCRAGKDACHHRQPGDALVRRMERPTGG
jgi:hypothetical protein